MLSARQSSVRAVQRAAAANSSHQRLAALTSTRGFWNVSNPNAGAGGQFVTKYKITMPGKEGVDYDDFLITLPERDHLAVSNKEIPLFIRFLKLVTDKEGRSDDFKDFVKRAKDGLSCESDVYITTEELLAVMWKNGFSEHERNALQFTFAGDAKFHYPELAVLFDLSEEDTYKFCLRARMEKSHIGALTSESQSWSGAIKDHALIFGIGAGIFKFFPFFNYYFIFKSFGTFMVGWSVWVMANRGMFDSISRNEFMTAQKVAADVMEGEDKIMVAMKRFANDSKALDVLSLFKDETNDGMANYRKALLENEKNAIIAKAAKQLQSIVAFEASTNSKLQASIVKEVVDDFRTKFTKQQGLASEALQASIKTLEGSPLPADQDPVTRELGKAIGSIDLSGKAKADANGTVSERLAFLQQQQEAEFVENFYVTKAESAAVKAAGSDAEKLEALQAKIYGKVGFHIPNTGAASGDLNPTGDASGDKFVGEVNADRKQLAEAARKQRLENFAASFA